MRLRKIQRKIYLGIYNLNLMDIVDVAFEIFTGGWNQIDKPFKTVYGNRFFGLSHVKIASDGEAYIELGEFYPKYGFYNVGTDFIKSLLQTMKLFYEGFEYYEMPNSPRINELPYESTKKNVKCYTAILNVWNDTYTDDDIQLLGVPFDPIKQAAFKPYWEIYNRLVNRQYTEATTTMPNDAFNELKDTYNKIPEFFNMHDTHFSYVNRNDDDPDEY